MLAFFLKLLRSFNVIYHVIGLNYYLWSVFMARFELNYYYIKLDELIKNGYYYFDYNIYYKLFTQFSLSYHPLLIRLIWFKYNKKLELNYITRKEFNKEFIKVNEEIKEKVFLIWDIAEYFGLYVETDASKIVKRNCDYIGCPTVIEFWFGFFDYNSLPEIENKIDDHIRSKLSDKEKEYIAKGQAIVKKDKERIEYKKKEIQELFKKMEKILLKSNHDIVKKY